MLNDKILIIINNYQYENKFAHYGVELAKRLERPALLTGIARIPKSVEGMGLSAVKVPPHQVETIDSIQKSREADLQKIYMKVREKYDQIDYEVKVGFPEKTIIDKTTKEKPFLVVVEGNNQFSTLSEWFGAYETNIAEYANRPVLIVPSEYSWKPVQNILYVMELQDDKAKNIRILYELSTALNANLHVMLTTEKNSEEVQERYDHIVEVLRHFYDYKKVRYSLVTNVDSAKQIQNMTENMLVDWLAIEHAEESFFSRVFSDLNSDKIILQSQIPVLVF